jgi:hypothetical protein
MRSRARLASHLGYGQDIVRARALVAPELLAHLEKLHGRKVQTGSSYPISQPVSNVS